MRNHLIATVCLTFSLLTIAQQKPAAKTKSSNQLGTHATANLPSEDDVNGFLEQTFGYDPQLTWKIVSVKPSQAEGLAEVNVLISGPQG